MVNCHKDLWKQRRHILAPLNSLTSPNDTFEWNDECQAAFDEMKRGASHETLLTFPDFNEEFHVHADASDCQPGVAIMQKGKPLAFCSRTLDVAQKACTTGEQELLSIAETLKEFRNMLFEQKIVVHTDHMNMLHANLTNGRIVRWRCLLEEHGGKFVHIRGVDNVVADALSGPDEEDKDVHIPAEKPMVMATTHLDHDKNMEIQQPHCFASLTDEELEGFPMPPPLIGKEQRKHKNFKQQLLKAHGDFKVTMKPLENVQLLWVNNRAAIPPGLTDRMLKWCHDHLNHPGKTRMHQTSAQTFFWPNMKAHCENCVKQCSTCQSCKKNNKKHGKLPQQKDVENSMPWNRVIVDLIGPLTVHAANAKFQLNALTVIDPATGWFEITESKDTKAATAAAAFDDIWLSRCPRPQCIGMDSGSENKAEFRETMINHGLGPGVKAATTQDPQSNSIVERIHQVSNDMLQTQESEERDLDKEDHSGEVLSAAACAIRCTFHTASKATPAQLVFGRDMILPIAM